MVVGIIRFARVPLLNPIALLYVEFIRGTPLLVARRSSPISLFRLCSTIGIPAYRAAISGFVLFIGAYLAEDFRTGLRSVRATLVQAGLATGLTHLQVLRLIILPKQSAK